MAIYTLLQRDQFIRAAQEADEIKQLQMCGYTICGEQEASNADEAVVIYEQNTPLEMRQEQKTPVVPPKYRKFLWFGGVCLVLWICFLIFGLLPLAYPS